MRARVPRVPYPIYGGAGIIEYSYLAISIDGLPHKMIKMSSRLGHRLDALQQKDVIYVNFWGQDILSCNTFT